MAGTDVAGLHGLEVLDGAEFIGHFGGIFLFSVWSRGYEVGVVCVGFGCCCFEV